MIIVMQPGNPLVEIERVISELRNWNVIPGKFAGQHKVVIGLLGDTAEIDTRQIQNLSPFSARGQIQERLLSMFSFLFPC